MLWSLHILHISTRGPIAVLSVINHLNYFQYVYLYLAVESEPLQVHKRLQVSILFQIEKFLFLILLL